MFNKKILCLGTNSSITDTETYKLAESDQTINHGLITDSNFIPTEFGYYHTTIVDLSVGSIIKLAEKFGSFTAAWFQSSP